MNNFKTLLIIGLTSLIFMHTADAPAVDEQLTEQSQTPQQHLSQVVEQNDRIITELRMIKREIALLKQEGSTPGIKDLIAGVGFIFGLFGAAAFASSKRADKRSKE